MSTKVVIHSVVDGFEYEEFIAAVMVLWSLKTDTFDMARGLECTEAEVARALWIGREQRRAGK